MSNIELLIDGLYRMRRELLGELQGVDAALRRIDEGKYGLCVRCGQTIDHQRLVELPATNWCRACKGEYEQRRGLVASGPLLLFPPRSIFTLDAGDDHERA